MALRMLVRLVLALFSLLLALAHGHAFVPGEDGPVTYQESLEGGNTTLRCNVSTDVSADELMLLVWYKGETPIYSYDARVESEWTSDTFNTNGRLKSDLRRDPTELKISRLTLEDQGLYHCRVDFLVSPTRNLGVNLTIIVLPSVPFFLDEIGNKVENKIGPYYEGDILVLSCLVIGGLPPPQISWYSGSSLVDSSDGPSDIPGVKENQLYLPLGREHAAPLSCRASNTKLQQPVVATLQVELYLPAESVSISWVEGATSSLIQAEHRVVVRCIARGSRPAPDLAWWLNHRHLTQHSNQSWSKETNTAESFLEFTASAADNGATLSCVATNVAMAPSRGSKADLINLNVTYSPIVEVVPIDVDRNKIIELDSLHLECEVRANPPVEKIIWYFNDKVMTGGGIWGDLNETSSTLLVEEANRNHTGLYSCAAVNSVGETRAHQLGITVLYSPECTEDAITLVEETVHCNVQSLPKPDTFFWHVRTSSGEQHLTTGSQLLPLTQLIETIGDTIQVTCEAGNGIASQEKPCVKIVSLAHLKPSPPKQCELMYEDDKFQIRCVSVENATSYEISVWRMSTSNTSLVLDRRVRSPVRSSTLVRMALNELKTADEVGASACNRYGCSRPLLLRPTDNLLLKAAPPWWHVFLEKDVGISVGAVVLVAAFVLSTVLIRRLFRTPRPKPDQPVIQVLQLDDVARDYLDTLERKHHAPCSSRSGSSGYSGGSLDSAPPVERALKPGLYYWDAGPPPDVTLTLHRESAV